jgi:hypothetical protein
LHELLKPVVFVLKRHCSPVLPVGEESRSLYTTARRRIVVSDR